MPKPSQIKMIYALMTPAQKACKAQLVLGITQERTDSIRALSDTETDTLITYLQAQQAKKNTTPPPGDKMRKKIISLAYQMNWTLKTPTGYRADVPRINAWCLKYGYLHKALNKYSPRELPKLLTQFENLYKSYLKAI